jgi:hypothetical protein
MAGERAGLGFCVHTGWAACVVASGSARAPRIWAREEVELLGDPARFVFHRAAKLELGAAASEVSEAARTVTARAREAIARIALAVRRDGGEIVGCAIAAKRGAMPGSLAEIVAAHPRIHTAEGCFYRDALVAAAEALGLAVAVIAPKDLAARAALGAKVSAEAIAPLLVAAGKAAGRPWAKDQKDAALAAWAILEQ